jgi:drug/metabolite transporter (DMT)-like permease
VLFGSVGGFTIYLLLIRDWGPSRAGAYAFVSPVIAVALGMLVFGERVGLVEAAGIVLMLSAAILALRERRAACAVGFR